jgi:hypothetical protein
MSDTVHGIHYSFHPNLNALHGGMFGSGIRSEEAGRVAHAIDPRIKQRVYFYNKTGSTLPRAEAGLGPHAYEVHLTHIFDGPTVSSADANLVQQFKKNWIAKGADNASAFESAVVDAGFHGYTNRGVTVLLGQTHVPVQRVGGAWGEEPRVPAGNPDGGQWTR